ncbi:methyltransferase domain-containing protein [Cognatishimia maritima]|uniref:Methyltransferase domain-containing protein n=1 Tax=Cognatishimia maritima TaxID=870908 RepID=A0A1M5WFI8_9RHOB|nr:methyltransferase domain-containing protein [Cognatishimia maritima]SHH86197.1 Methyltransferase domain-containing protein [Cognatishimia maritima]
MHGYWKDFCVVDDEAPDLGGNLLHGDTQAITPALWRFLIDRFSPRTVLDIGAGEGNALSFFHRQGIIAHGFDGLPRNVLNAKYPIALHDLKAGPYIYPCDLVHCVEVVEHIKEEFIDNLLKTLINAPIVMMTHALPGQKGHHHVNTQPEAYWIDKMSEYGYALSLDNAKFREIASRENADSYFGESGLIFLRRLSDHP